MFLVPRICEKLGKKIKKLGYHLVERLVGGRDEGKSAGGGGGKHHQLTKAGEH